MVTEDMSRYLGVFLDEAAEQIELLEQAFLVLEHDSTSELLQQIFRAAHTLKGSSRAMGYTSMGELTHAMEDVFDALRNGKMEVSSSIVDILLESLDQLKQLQSEISANGETTTSTDVLTAKLRNLLGARAEPQLSESNGGNASSQIPEMTAEALDAVAQARSSGYEVFQLTVTLSDDCAMKSVRALMVMQSLEAIGSILATAPCEEAIENEEFDHSFCIILASAKDSAEIERTTNATSEIAGIDLKVFANQTTETTRAEIVDQRVADLGIEARGKSPEEIADMNRKVGGQSLTQARTVRVDVARLDNLLNLVGELVIDQTRIEQLTRQLVQERNGDATIDNLSDASSHLDRILAEMQLEVMKARMQPIDYVFNRFPRMMRDLAQNLGREIDFVVMGKDTELDRSVIEVIGDPLIHLLRNCMDHGVEMPEVREQLGKPRKGQIWLRARHEENYVVIEVEDDGKGIDPEKIRQAAVSKGVLSEESAARLNDKEAINLIFASGFSTAERVTEVSGRGVGMDIVRNNLLRFGAVIEIDTKLGRGSKFTVKLPLTLAIIRGLLVKAMDSVFAVPLASVVETIKLDDAQLHTINTRKVIVQRGLTLPLLGLSEVYGRYEHSSGTDQYVVVVRQGDRQVGLVVDALLGEQEVVIKPLGNLIGDVHGISGATILGDGSIALIADVNGLITMSAEDMRGVCAA